MQHRLDGFPSHENDTHPSRVTAMAREKQSKGWKFSRMIRLKLLGQSE